MAIYDYLPKFKQVEPNNLKGLQAGFVVAQMEVAESAKAAITYNGEGKIMENGVLCSISKDGIIKAAEGLPVFLHFSEELLTLNSGKRFFGVELDHENPRLVQLIPGDEWMTDYVYDAEELTQLGIVELTAENTQSKDDWYSVTKLADGTAAKHYMYIGVMGKNA